MSAAPTHHFRLFVDGDGHLGRRAHDTLDALCRQVLQPDGWVIDVIDIAKCPELAEEHRILATPTIIRHQPPPTGRFVGDLRRVTCPEDILGIP